MDKIDFSKTYAELEPPEGEQKVEQQATVEKAEEVPVISEEETKVPYSRFKKFHDAAKEAEEEALKWKQRAEELEQQKFERREIVVEGEVPSWWKELYGDTEVSQKAYKIQSQHEADIASQAEDRAFRRLQETQQAEANRYQENLSSIDEHLELVSAVAGRDLTEDEQSKLLDIVDEFTPKDDDGNYAGSLISPDKAWEIYEMKNQSAHAQRKASRNEVASIISSQSSGEPNADQTEKNKSWNPLSWPDWRNLT